MTKIYANTRYSNSITVATQKHIECIQKWAHHLDRHDAIEVYQKCWARRFNQLFPFDHCNEDGRLMYLRGRYNYAHSDGVDPMRLDMNKTPEQECERMTQYVIDIFGSTQAFCLFVRYDNAKMWFGKITDKEITLTIDDNDYLFDFVKYLIAGNISAEGIVPNARPLWESLGITSYNQNKFSVTVENLSIKRFVAGHTIIKGLTVDQFKHLEVYLQARKANESI